MLNIDELIEKTQKLNPHVFESIKVQRIVTWNDIDTVLASGLLDYPRIRVAKNNNDYSKSYNGFLRYTSSVRGEKQAWIVPGVLCKIIKNGCTVIIDRCETFFPGIKEVVEEISSSLSCNAWANLYISPRGCGGFGCHFDDHDVLAIQVYGRKQWKIFEPTYQSPNRGDKSFYLPEPKGEPLVIEELAKGGGIYLPYGYWHDVETLSEISLHITIGLDFPRKLDVLQLICNELSRDKYFRDRLSVQKKSDELRSQLIDKIKEIDIDGLDSLVREKFTMNGPKIEFSKLYEGSD